MKPNQKETASNDFFNAKIKFEAALLKFEKLQTESKEYLDSMETHVKKMILLAENTNSPYFLQRSKRLELALHKLKLKKDYKQKEFDPLFHILSKIVNEDGIEFLNTALRNRISKIAYNLTENKQKTKSNLKDKLIFISFVLDGLHFLVPKKPYKILKSLPAFKKQIRMGNKTIPLFPGPGFGLTQNKAVIKKNVLILKDKNFDRGFYFDELGEDWAISKQSLEPLIQKETNNEHIEGKIRRKGITYHLIKV
ncbi:hypothetical protein P3G55_01975 [Leptospira sp. 96542]|nr:hypothetical protein [Leptospira sp. 96542]